MALSKLKAKIKGIKYVPFEQDGKTYNLYDMPKGFVIKGDLNLSYKGLTELPDLSEVVVKGDFSCYDNKLTSLKGAPKEVGRSFNCNANNLTSLEGAPQRVGKNFDCHSNQLTSLEGAPQTVGGDFGCHGNNLTSLKGAPQTVGGSFSCHYNQLTSLEGVPQRVGEGFNCENNRLTSLDGAPQKVDGCFICSNNQLTSLEGAPQRVGGDFYCYANQLTSLEGAPKEVGGSFECYSNQLTSLVGLPQMKESGEIHCDDSLGNKYGFSATRNFGVSYKNLCASPLYKTETAMNRVRSKLPQEKTETKTKQQEAFEKTNAEFSQWLKDNSAKPTRE